MKYNHKAVITLIDTGDGIQWDVVMKSGRNHDTRQSTLSKPIRALIEQAMVLAANLYPASLDHEAEGHSQRGKDEG